jgi:hypothetical protein
MKIVDARQAFSEVSGSLTLEKFRFYPAAGKAIVTPA